MKPRRKMRGGGRSTLAGVKSPKLVRATRKSDDGRVVKITFCDGFAWEFLSERLRSLALDAAVSHGAETDDDARHASQTA